jgi:hypothetical protein
MQKCKKGSPRLNQGSHHAGNLGIPKQEETTTRTSKRPRPECSTPTERVRPLKRTRDSRKPRTDKKPLTNIKIAIFKVGYPQDNLIEEEQDIIIKELGSCSMRL